MSAIDVHVHAFPDALAKRALRKLQADCPWKPVAAGTIKSLRKSMDDADIDVSVVCAIATKSDQAEGILDWCRKVRSDRIEPFPSVHPDAPDAARWVERIAHEEFAGVKLHPMYQSFAIDEQRMDAIYSAAQACGLVVALHCGRDIAFPMTDDRAAPVRIRRVIERFSGLKVICTHMGGWRDWDAACEHLVGSSVYLETSFSLQELGPERSVEIIRRHGTQRVLFGTDWPWEPQEEQIALLRQLGLNEREQDQILWSNAARMLGY